MCAIALKALVRHCASLASPATCTAPSLVADGALRGVPACRLRVVDYPYDGSLVACCRKSAQHWRVRNRRTVPSLRRRHGPRSGAVPLEAVAQPLLRRRRTLRPLVARQCPTKEMAVCLRAGVVEVQLAAVGAAPRGLDAIDALGIIGPDAAPEDPGLEARTDGVGLFGGVDSVGLDIRVDSIGIDARVDGLEFVFRLHGLGFVFGVGGLGLVVGVDGLGFIDGVDGLGLVVGVGLLEGRPGDESPSRLNACEGACAAIHPASPSPVHVSDPKESDGEDGSDDYWEDFRNQTKSAAKKTADRAKEWGKGAADRAG